MSTSSSHLEELTRKTTLLLNSNLKDALIEILKDHTSCIAHEINDRAYDEHANVFFESFRSLREIRDDLISKGIVEELLDLEAFEDDLNTEEEEKEFLKDYLLSDLDDCIEHWKESRVVWD